MIHGIGTDIVEVARIKKAIRKTSRFAARVFSEAEIRYCEESGAGLRYERYAARFAAKEAFLKACGTGLREGFSLTEITVKNAESGKPEIVLSGGSLETFKEKIQGGIHLSLSHLPELAMAVAVIEK